MTANEKKKEYNKQYRLQNRDRLLAKKKTWQQDNKEKIKTWHQSPIGKYKAYRDGAKKRNMEFNLTLEEFSSYWQLDCNYCGSSIATIGLDRIDSSIGYNINNIVPCCSRCNEMKMDSSTEAWMDKMFTILKKQGVI